METAQPAGARAKASAMSDEARAAPREFSITSGGPFKRLARRLRLLDSRGAVRVWRLTAVAWLPLLVGSLIRMLLGGGPDPMVLDLSVHVRFLIALPLLVLSERLLEPQCRAAVTQLYVGNLADAAALDRVIARAERMRDAPWAELVLAGLAVLGGELLLWGVTGPTGLFHGVEQVEWTVSRIWYAVIAWPLLQFLAWRWLWRWGIWTIVLVRIVRLPLAATATHPDRAAGLRFLSGPVTGFAAYVLAYASVLAGAWGTQLLAGRVTVPSLVPSLILLLVVAFLIACGPLLPFTVHLYRAQRRSLLAYGPFALDYVRRFHGKWIEGRSEEQVLGTPDIQSWSDLDNAYQAIQSTSMFVFSSRKLAELWLAAIVPMLPLVATVVPIDELLKRIGSALLGGLLP